MSTRNRRLNTWSSSSTAKRSSIVGNKSKMGAAKTQFTKKRAALSDITNQENGSESTSRVTVTHSKQPLVLCNSKVAKKKETSTCTQDNGLPTDNLPRVPSLDICTNISCMDTIRMKDGQPTTEDSCLLSPMHNPRNMDISPCRSPCGSVFLDETMSICDSLKSPEFQYVDVSAVKLIERMARNSLYTSDYKEKEGTQFSVLSAYDIYMSARASEAKKRPSMDFMEIVQKDINCSMRAILVDWLVEVTEEYRLVHETLFLTVNYVDRYLSGNSINRQQLQLLGVACMMIASKYEEICAPQVKEFCYVTDNTYCKDEILQMESAVLNYLKFEMTVPTANFFVKQFIHVAQRVDQVRSMQFQCLANYIAELSLLEYSMLPYAPSLIAASATFLAKFILYPSRKPWDSVLRDYTLYEPSDLCECVKALHHLCRIGGRPNLPAIREKYSQHMYKFVAKKYCPASIPQEFFQDLDK